MKNEIMASFLLAGAVLLLGVGGYITLSGTEANSTSQENMTANVSIPQPAVVANATNVSNTPARNVSGNGSANATNVTGAVANSTAANNTANTTANGTASHRTNITIVYNDTPYYYGGSSSGSSSSSSSGSSGSSSGSNSQNNTHPANTTHPNSTILSSSGGLLRYNDCLAVSNGKVCLSDIAAESPNEAILAVYDAKGNKVSNVMVAPNGHEAVSLGDGKIIYISVFSTAISGTNIQALAYISNSGIASGQSVSQGNMNIGDCVGLANSSVCLADIAADYPHQAIFSAYDANGRLISNVIVPVGEPISVVIGNGKSISVTVSQTTITNGSAWATVTVRYIASDFTGKLLYYGECINTSHASVCLADVAASSPYEAVFEVHDIDTGKLLSNVMVAPGTSKQAKLDDSSAVLIYVYGTMINGSSVWTLADATEEATDSGSVSGTIGFDECVSSDFAKVCLSDIGMDSPHDAILTLYGPSGDFISNVEIAPGSSKTIPIDDSSSAAISVMSTAFDMNTSTFEAAVVLARG
jgi:hypothetical protein